MPISLRARPVCHYCGKRNKPINSQRFRCQHCLAENFLDEDGEIADVPAEIAAPPIQYAQPATSHRSTADSIFCPTCIKNQAFYTAALSEFLPDPDHDEYERFEAALPEFKNRMEKQYPQCCAQCEPKVRAQIQQASYNARTDHLRRVLDKSRSRRIAHRLGWRSLLVSIAGVGALFSLSLQLLWHAMGSQSAPGISYTRPSDCLRSWPVPRSCANSVESYLWLSFITGLLCIWWNPRWQDKLQGRADRLKSLSTYYRTQAILLALRFVAWILITDVPTLSQQRNQLHSVSLVLIALIAVYSTYGIIKVDNTPLVNWQQDPAPLLVSEQFEAPPPLATPPSSQDQTFALDNLRSVSAPQYSAWRQPTPPADTDADAMDWAPSPSTFAPNPKQVSYKSTQPTPFHGVLPQLPRGSIFASRTQVEQSKPIGIPMGFFDKTTETKTRAGTGGRAALAQPKFFPNSDRADTGLESIFGKVFSLQDDTLEVRKESKVPQARPGIFDRQPQHSTPYQRSLGQRILNAVAIVILLIFTAYLAFYSYLGQPCPPEAATILATTCLVLSIEAASSVIERTNTSKALFYLGECGCIVALISNRPERQSLLSPLWNKLAIGALSSLTVQEVYTFCMDDGSPAPLPPTKRSLTETKKTPPPSLGGRYDGEAYDSFLPPEPTPPALVRRDSMSSIASDSSINSTSTASGWKTPIVNHRQDLSSAASTPSSSRNRRPSSNAAFGIGSLGLNDFSVGTSVAGPRTTRRSAASRQAR